MHTHAPHTDNTAFAIAVLLTLLYTMGEGYFGIATHSMSLLSDAVHNLGDSLGLILAWIANRLLSVSPKKRYSYGFKRTTIMASLVNACLLIATSAIISWESIHRLFSLTPLNTSTVISVALIGILVNGGSALLFTRESKHDLNIRGAFLHLLMDASLLNGVVFSAMIIYYTHWYWVDPVVGLMIVGFVLRNTWFLLRDSLALMMDAIPRYIDRAGVETYLKQLPGVSAIHDLHIWGLSTREIALTAHLIMPTQPLTDDDHQHINDTLRTQFHIHHVTLQVETGHSHAMRACQTQCDPPHQPISGNV